jgi:hypothetical protein
LAAISRIVKIKYLIALVLVLAGPPFLSS